MDYTLYVKTGKRWEKVRTFEAANHTDAFAQAMLNLKPEHYPKQIRLEREVERQQRRKAT